MLDIASPGGHPGTLLRQLRYTRGRRISQRALAVLLDTSRAHIARLELQGFPPLTEEQLDRLEKAGDAVSPPFSRTEIDELRTAMHAVRATTVEQASKAVQDIAGRAGKIFITTDKPGEREQENSRKKPPDPFASSPRPRFLTEISQVVNAAQEDVEHLLLEHRARQPSRVGAEPDLIMTIFGRQRNLVEEAEEPEKFRDVIRELLRVGGTVEILIAPSPEEASEDLVALVPPMIYHLGLGGSRYRVHVIDESGHPWAYGVCVAGNRGLLIARGDGGRTVAVRTNDRADADALRDLLRPHWENKESIIEEAGRRTKETLTGRSAEPSVALSFEQLLTSVEVEEGPRRLVKNGLSILNIPVAIHAWKWRAAELCMAGWIPEDLLEVLHAQAWGLADRGLRQLPPNVLDKYSRRRRVRALKALEALEQYAQGLHRRHAAWRDHLSRHQFWDASPKSALKRFISRGELPPDEIPPSCGYSAERDDIETIITRLIFRLRSSRNYHLALVEDEDLFPQWFYLGVKGAHVLAQVFDSLPSGEGADQAVRASDNMLNIHIRNAPIAEAFSGWFDERVLKTAVHPSWQDNHGVADWLETELRDHGRSQ